MASPVATSSPASQDERDIQAQAAGVVRTTTSRHKQCPAYRRFELWRNVWSVTLDRGIFPKLAATPGWLRGLYVVLTFAPLSRHRLLDPTLWTQLQTIFFAHGFHLDHGYVLLTWPWTDLQPFGGQAPMGVRLLEVQSRYLIARVAMTSSYWGGRIFLGMKGE